MLSGPGGLEDTATLGVLLVCLLVEGCLGLLQAPRSRPCCLVLEDWRTLLHLVSCWSICWWKGVLVYLLVLGCLGLLQASLKQNIASGQVGLGDTATLSVLLVLCYLHFWVFGLEVWWSVSASHSLPGPDHIVWAWRTGGSRRIQRLAG